MMVAQQLFADPTNVSGAVERIGVAGVLVVAAYFLVKYFISQLDKKDQRLNDVTDRFLEATKEQTRAIGEFVHEQRESNKATAAMADAIHDLKAAIDHLQAAAVRR